MIANRWPLTRLDGVIERRILVNFRVDPARLALLLPPPFAPQTVNGYGMAGICLIRLRDVRPSGLPSFGLTSENAAHRIAVQWRADGVAHSGVFITRRDTNSWLTLAAGGRLFPGAHHRAKFRVEATPSSLELSVLSDDGLTDIEFSARPAECLPSSSVFASLAEASRFFEVGAIGFSPDNAGDRLQGLQLRTMDWRVTPLDVAYVHSTFFAPGGPMGADAEFDSALLMRNVACHWNACPPPKTDSDRRRRRTTWGTTRANSLEP